MTTQAVDETTSREATKVDALVYKIGDITCDFSNNYLDDGEQTHWLMLKEAQTLLTLVRAYPNPVKPIELHQDIWQAGPLNESLIDRVIVNLREKLNDLEAEVIRKVPDFGYVLTVTPRAVIHTSATKDKDFDTQYSYQEIYKQPRRTADIGILKQAAIYCVVPIFMAVAFQLGVLTHDKFTGYKETAQWITLSKDVKTYEIDALKNEYSGSDSLYIDKTKDGKLIVCSLQSGHKGLACNTK
ncbi:winged helix-turn-helix domain-containing protein [Thaumasiovibrio sp. DFM-14]|uniref:winged helix-turn-helix domain-containing protein n=1 Tax=Thaumasiovibrio sp. DFM-14 TaxID=3384792 RepID=UPI0039A1761E